MKQDKSAWNGEVESKIWLELAEFIATKNTRFFLCNLIRRVYYYTYDDIPHISSWL